MITWAVGTHNGVFQVGRQPIVSEVDARNSGYQGDGCDLNGVTGLSGLCRAGCWKLSICIRPRRQAMRSQDRVFPTLLGNAVAVWILLDPDVHSVVSRVAQVLDFVLERGNHLASPCFEKTSWIRPCSS